MTLSKDLFVGDCISELRKLDDNTVNLIYMDPPFFTQKTHALTPRMEEKEYSFNDKWETLDAYLNMIKNALVESRRVLKPTGSLFLHCDKAASHRLRILLDDVFGSKNFRSEIIWAYKRWSNSRKGLLNSHQNIYFYSKSQDFKFNVLYTGYAPSTNIDQILQARGRNGKGKSAYMKDEKGNVLLGKEKKGVPLSDVWNIPFLNPKAKERVGYPTQKPVLLLERILLIATDEGDLVLDPFCGSGTTCVAAKLLTRGFIGIDQSKEAIGLTRKRLKEMVVSNSRLLEKGEESYIEKNERQLAILSAINAIPVQRNQGIDGFLKEHIDGKPVPVKIQAHNEPLREGLGKLKKAAESHKFGLKIFIKTNEKEQPMLFENVQGETDILIIDSYDLLINRWTRENSVTRLKSVPRKKVG